MNFDKLKLENLSNLSDISRRDVLDALGLRPTFRDYAGTALGMLTAGVVIGAGAALLLAPKSGSALRADISDEVKKRMDSLEERINAMSGSGNTSDDPLDVEVVAA